MSDAANDFQRRVERRLREEEVIWLTTVGADGTPQPSPVWFLWDGTTLLIYSRPNTPKLRNIARHPRVALNLNSDGQGDDIVIMTGEAEIHEGAAPSNEVPAYLEKYRSGIARIGMTPESFAAGYSVAIRVTPGKLRGY